MGLFESFGKDDKQEEVPVEKPVAEAKKDFEIQQEKRTGLFENFGQEKKSAKNTAVDEKEGQQKSDQGEKQKIAQNHVEEKNDSDEAKKAEYETFNQNVDRWQRNKIDLKSFSEEIEKDNLEISKIQVDLVGQEKEVNSIKNYINEKTTNLDDIIKNGKGKGVNPEGFTVTGNLLPTLKTDYDSGYMTEKQQAYLSKGITEVCTQSRITSIDKLRDIFTAFVNSEVVDNICNNDKLIELVEKKQKQTRIMVTGGTFVLVLLMLFLFGGVRSVLAMGVALIGIVGLMGIIGYGLFQLSRDYFLWNLAVSILVTVLGAVFGGCLISVLLLDPLVNLIQEGNFVVIAIISVLFAVLAFILVGTWMKSTNAISKMCSNQTLIREARREIYIDLENKQLQNIPVVIYLYCLLNYKTIIDYLNGISLDQHIAHENNEIAKLQKQMEEMQRKQEGTYQRKKYLEQLLESKKQKIQDISSENDKLYKRIDEWKLSPKLSWLEEWTINPEVVTTVHNTMFCMKHNGNIPLVLDTDLRSIESSAPWVNAIIAGFQKGNPAELLDIAVIDLALNANQWKYLLSSTKMGIPGSGDSKVQVISSNADLKAYCSKMEKEAEEQIRFFENHRDDTTMMEIVENSEGAKTIRELNQYNKQIGMEPNKYHIAIILPENIQREDSKMLIRSLSSGAYCGFIPVILKKSNNNMYDEWNLITEKANWYYQMG